MEYVYHIVTIRVNDTSWAHVWRLRSCYLRMGYDMSTLEGMVESRDELLLEITRETGLDHMGEGEEEEEEDTDDGGDAAAPPVVAPPPRRPLLSCLKRSTKRGPMEAIPEQEVLTPHDVVLAEAEPDIPQLHLYRALMRDYEENPLRLEDDIDDLNDYPSGGRYDVDE
jgi:hypothetical protein